MTSAGNSFLQSLPLPRNRNWADGQQLERGVFVDFERVGVIEQQDYTPTLGATLLHEYGEQVALLDFG